MIRLLMAIFKGFLNNYKGGDSPGSLALLPVLNNPWRECFIPYFQSEFPCLQLWLFPVVLLLCPSLRTVSLVFSRLNRTRPLSLSWFMGCSSAIQWPVWGSHQFVCIYLLMGHLKQLQYSRCGLSSEEMGINSSLLCSPSSHGVQYAAALQPLVHQLNGGIKRPFWHN